MFPRTNYEMTQSDLDKILDACKPTPVMMIGGSCAASPQENANAAWAELGGRMGFDPMTVQPVAGKGYRFFTAIPTENADQRAERIERERVEKRDADIETARADLAAAELKLAQLLNDQG